MPQTYSQMTFHLIFATKYRSPLILPSLQEPLYGQLWELTSTLSD
jgi:REP element-mobilizing transposase RayT